MVCRTIGLGQEADVMLLTGRSTPFHRRGRSLRHQSTNVCRRAFTRAARQCDPDRATTRRVLVRRAQRIVLVEGAPVAGENAGSGRERG